MATIRKDGKAYDGGDVTIHLLGDQANEVEEINYGSEQDHQMNYSLGNNRGTTWSQGKISETADITIAMTEATQIERIAPNGYLPNIKPFDIAVSFVNEFNAIVVDILTVKFKNQGRQVTTDMGLKYKYDLFVLNIDFNVL